MSALITGRRWQGKSTLAMYLAVQRRMGVAVFDPSGRFTRFPQFQDVEKFEDAMRSGQHWVVCYRPTRNIDDEFEEFCTVMNGFDSYTLLIDEASQLQSPSWLHPDLERYMRFPNPAKVCVIQTMHRPQDAHGLCRSLVNDLLFFRTTLSRDLDIIRDQCGAVVARAVSGLPPFQFVHWSEDRESFEVCADNTKWYIKISKEEENQGARRPEVYAPATA